MSWIFIMLHHLVRAQVCKQILNWWSPLRNTPFSLTRKISVVKGRTKFETFCFVLYEIMYIFRSSCIVPWLQQKWEVHHFCWSVDEPTTSCAIATFSNLPVIHHKTNAPSSTDDMLILKQCILSEWITSSVGGTYIVSNFNFIALPLFRN
jgi:hypothetical protein